MVARQQHGGHGPLGATHGQPFGAAVLRAFEQPVGEAVLLVRRRVQDAVLQARHGVEQRQGGQFAARQDEVAEAQFMRDMGIDEALVDALDRKSVV